jgi:hypothetical protein
MRKTHVGLFKRNIESFGSAYGDFRVRGGHLRNFAPLNREWVQGCGSGLG